MTPELWRQIEQLYHLAADLTGDERNAVLERAGPDVRQRVEAMLGQPSGSKLMDWPDWANKPAEIRKVLAAAIEKTPTARAAYLDQTCGRTALRSEMESLVLAHEQGNRSFSEAPALESGANGALKSGAQLGPYQVLERIGAGGMGEVYRARDIKLNREVALKVLPDALMHDRERLVRFEREAKVLASLNHPNIAQIYAVEQNALVMELVAGRTLQSPLSLKTALNYARQIAEALEVAHEKGIVHRDLKPANIMTTPEGMVKVLDFGLAAVERSADPSEPGNSATSPTRAGTILGTAAYMSPEQVRGISVDRRADIWAFGVVLYEMLTNERLFKAESIPDTLAAVLSKEPDWSALPAATPLQIRGLLHRCLERDRRKRLQAIGEARIAIEEVLSGTPDDTAPTSTEASAPIWQRSLPWAISGVLSLATVLLAFLYLHQESHTTGAVRFEVALPENVTSSGISVISPDGSKLAIVATGADGIARLWIRSLDTLGVRPLEGSEGVSGYPFWSPDNRFIAYLSQGKLKKIAASGGPSETICETSTVWGGAWNRDGKIIFGTNTGTVQIPAAGGSPSFITVGGFSVTPSFLPDGRHFVYLRYATAGGRHIFGIYLATVDTKPEGQPDKPLLPDYTFVAFGPSYRPDLGYLLFVRGATEVGAVGTLMAQPINTRRLELAGDAIPIAAQVSNTSLSASAQTVLVYASGEQALPGSVVAGNLRGKLTWFDRQGKILGAFGDTELYRTLSLSPDGTRVAFEAPSPTSFDNRNIWLYEFGRGAKTRFTFDQHWDVNPVWSPDGRQIAFGSDRNRRQVFDLYRRASNLVGEDQLLFTSNESKILDSWSPDGRFVLYNNTATPSQLWLLAVSDGAERKPVQLERSQFNQTMGRFSADGHWIAYSSDESGREEIYVRAFEAPSDAGSSAVQRSVTGKWMVSRDGGTSPLWRRDGKELLFLSRDATVMSAEVDTHGAFRAGIPKPLFKAPTGVDFWDLSSDGKRFLMPAPSAGSPPFTVVMNWQAILQK